MDTKLRLLLSDIAKVRSEITPPEHRDLEKHIKYQRNYIQRLLSKDDIDHARYVARIAIQSQDKYNHYCDVLRRLKDLRDKVQQLQFNKEDDPELLVSHSILCSDFASINTDLGDALRSPRVIPHDEIDIYLKDIGSEVGKDLSQIFHSQPSETVRGYKADIKVSLSISEDTVIREAKGCNEMPAIKTENPSTSEDTAIRGVKRPKEMTAIKTENPSTSEDTITKFSEKIEKLRNEITPKHSDLEKHIKNLRNCIQRLLHKDIDQARYVARSAIQSQDKYNHYCDVLRRLNDLEDKVQQLQCNQEDDSELRVSHATLCCNFASIYTDLGEIYTDLGDAIGRPRVIPHDEIDTYLKDI